MAKENGFFNTIKRLFGSKKEEQNNSTGTTTSAAPASTQPATQQPQQQAPVYKDNSIVTRTNNGGLYQYNTGTKASKGNSGFANKNEFNQQYNYALSLGYDQNQAFEALKNGTRWKEVALGQNGRAILPYETGKKATAQDNGFSSKEEFDQQLQYAMQYGYSQKDAFKALADGVRWMEEPEPPKQLWENEDYKRRADNRNFLQNAVNFQNWVFAEEAGMSAEDQVENQLRLMGLSSEQIQKVHENGSYDTLVKQAENRYQDIQPANVEGKATANLTLGMMSQQWQIMMAQGVLRADEEMLNKAWELKRQSEEYAARNEAALNYDAGTVGNALAGDIAQYLPQNLYQRRAAAPFALFGADSQWLEAISQGFGTGALSYNSMLGASYADLVEKGADPVAAANMARDEGMISGTIEGLGQLVSWGFGAYSNLTGGELAAKKAAQAAEKETARLLKPIYRQILSGLAKWGYEGYQEGAEEVEQELVSMANERRLAEGHTDGGVGELLAYWLNEIGIQFPGFVDALWNSRPFNKERKQITEEAERLLEAGRGGAVIGLVLGGAGSFTGIVQDSAQHVLINRALDVLTPEQARLITPANLNVLAEYTARTGKENARIIIEQEQDRRAQEQEQKNAEARERNIQQAQQVGDQYNPVEDPDSDFYEAPEQEAAPVVEAQPEVASETQPAAEAQLSDNMQDIQAFQRLARNGLENIPNRMLGQYYNTVNAEIESLQLAMQQSGSDFTEQIQRLEDQKAAIIAEGDRRQTAEKQAKEAEKTQPKAEQTTTTQPAEKVATPTQQEYTESATKSTEGAKQNDNPRRDSNNDQRSAGGQTPVQQPDRNVQPASSQAQNNEQVEPPRSGAAEAGNQNRAGNGERSELPARSVEMESDNGRSGTDQQPVSEQVNAGSQQREEVTEEKPKKKKSKRAKENERRIRALEQHFGNKGLLRNARKAVPNCAKLRDFGLKVFENILGDSKKAQDLILRMAAYEVKTYDWIYGNLLNEYKLSDEEKSTVYQAMAVFGMVRDVLDGNLDESVAARMLDMSEEDFHKLMDGSTRIILSAMVDEGILDSEYKLKNRFARMDKINAMHSGKGNKIISAVKDAVGKANTVTYNVEFKEKAGDVFMESLSDNDHKVYKRGKEYIAVNADGFELGRVQDEDDIKKFLRNTSDTYLSGRFSVFDKKFMNRLEETGEIEFNTEKAFGLSGYENMVLRSKSEFSDLLNITYRSNPDVHGMSPATTSWITVDFTVTKDVAKRYSLADMEAMFNRLIEDDYDSDLEIKKKGAGIKSKGGKGKDYRFFGPTANGAKKGEFIFVDADEYTRMRKASLSGLSPMDIKNMSLAKYLTAATSIVTPSNTDTGVGMNEVVFVRDPYILQRAVLRQFMNTGKKETRDELIKQMTPRRNELMRDKGMTKEAADAEVAAEVDKMIADNKVGTMINVQTDLLKQMTDGCGWMWGDAIGTSYQFRGPGAFKGLAVHFNFQQMALDCVPFDPTGKSAHLYYGEDGNYAGGFRYIDKNVGVEIMDYWGEWQPLSKFKAVLFGSTFKFIDNFNSSKQVWDAHKDANGKYRDLRSIPRENVYGADRGEGMVKGYNRRNVAQFLRGQYGFSEEVANRVFDEHVTQLITNIENDYEAQCQLAGVDIHSKMPPKKTDTFAMYIWNEHRLGRNAFQTREGRKFLEDKKREIINAYQSGDMFFEKGTSFNGWIAPDMVGLFNAMTVLDAIETAEGTYKYTEGNGLTITVRDGDGNVIEKDYGGLKANEISNMQVGEGLTAIGRNPSVAGNAVQVRENVKGDIRTYIHERYGLDPENIYLSVQDVLEKYLDGDFDGDTAFIFQKAIAQLIQECRSKDPAKGYIDFAHAKGVAKNVSSSAAIAEAARIYLEASKDRNIGMYDNMLERLYSIPAEYYDKAAEAEGWGKNAGQKYLSAIEATFGVAYVLSIDFSKTGAYFEDYDNMVTLANQLVYKLAAANNIINPGGLELDENYVFKPSDLVPETFFASRKGNKIIASMNALKAQAEAEAQGKELRNTSRGTSALYALTDKNLPSFQSFVQSQAIAEERWNGEGLKKKDKEALSRRRRQRQAQATEDFLRYAMTADPGLYSGIKPEILKVIEDEYERITKPSKNATAADDEYLVTKDSDSKEIERKKRLLCDVFFNRMATNLGLSTQQVTDILLYTLAKRGTSFKMLTNLNQRKYMKNFKGLTTMQIVSRNVTARTYATELLDAHKTLHTTINQITNELKQAEKALYKATEKYAEVKSTARGAVEAKQSIILRSAASIQSMIDRINKLGRQLDSIHKGKMIQDGKHISRIPLVYIAEANAAIRNIRDEMAQLNAQIAEATKDRTKFTNNIVERALVENDNIRKTVAETLKPYEQAIDKAYVEVESLSKAAEELQALYDQQIEDYKRFENSDARQSMIGEIAAIRKFSAKDVEDAINGKRSYKVPYQRRQSLPPIEGTTPATAEQLEAIRNNPDLAIPEESSAVRGLLSPESLQADADAEYEAIKNSRYEESAPPQETVEQPAPVQQAEQPSQKNPTANRQILLKNYRTAVKKLASIAPDIYQKINVRGVSDADVQAELDKVNALIEEQTNPKPPEPPEPPAPPTPPSPPPEPPAPPAPPEPPAPPAPTPPPAPKSNPEPKAEVQKPERIYGEHTEAVSKKAKQLDNFSKRFGARIDKTMSGDSNASTLKHRIEAFADVVSKIASGKATPKQLYDAYLEFKGTRYFSDDENDVITSAFETLRNRENAAAYLAREEEISEDALSDRESAFNEELANQYGEAIDHALSAFIARAQRIERVERNLGSYEQESKDVKAPDGFKKLLSTYNRWQQNAPTFFRALAGFKKGTQLYKLAERLDGYKGAEYTNQKLNSDAAGVFERIASMPEYDKLINGKLGFDLEVGNETRKQTVHISAIDAVNFYRQIKTYSASHDNVSKIEGFVTSDGKEIKLAPLVEDGSGHSTRLSFHNQVQSQLHEYLSQKAPKVVREYNKACSEVFAMFAPQAQRVFQSVNGFSPTMYSADVYAPLAYDTSELAENFNAMESAIKNSPRYMKERSDRTGYVTLKVESMDAVMSKYVRQMADYIAYAGFRNDLRLMNQNAGVRNSKTISEIAGEHLGREGANFINEYIKDMTEYSGESDSLFAKMRQRMQKGILIGNPSVMMKQAASYFNAAGFIDMKYLLAAMPKAFTNRMYGNGKAAALDYRRFTGNFDPTLSETFGNKASKNRLVRFFQSGISKIDHATVNGIYIAACMQVKAQTNLNENSAEFDERVDQLFTEAVLATQPQFNQSLRAENARTDRQLVRATSMFRTQPTQNYNRLVRTIGEYMANKNDPVAKRNLSQTLQGQIASTLAFAVMSSVAAAMLHRLKRFRDLKDEDKDGDKNEFSASRLYSRLGMDFVETAANTFWFGGDVAKWLIDTISKGDTKEFYGVNLGPVDLVFDLTDSFKDFVAEPSVDAFRKFASYATETAGIPINNLYSLGNSALMYYLDVTGENPDKFDDIAKYFDDHMIAQKQLIRAAESGNTKKTNKLWNQLQGKYKNPANQLNAQLHEDYNKGNVSSETAQNLLLVYGGLEDQEAAQKRVAWWDFKNEHPEYEDMTEANVAKWNSVAEPVGVPLDTFYKATKHFAELRKDKENGKDNLAMLQYIDSLGLTQSQKDALWNCFGTNVYTPYDSTKGVYADYQSYGKPAGFTAEDFTAYYDKCNSFNSDKDKNGKTTKSKQQKVIAYINSLNISKAQKDALFLSMNYKKTSKAWKTRPWR